MAASGGLFKETIIYSIGSFGAKALSFLLVPLYSFFLTKKDMGEYDLFLTTVMLLVPLVSMQLSDAVYRWLIADNEEGEDALVKKKKAVTNSIIAFCAAFILFVILFYGYCSIYDFAYSQYFSLTILFSCLVPYLQSILRGIGKIKEYAANGIITSFLIVVCNVLFLYVFKLKVDGILIANIIANALGCLIIVIRTRLYIYFEFRTFDIRFLRKMLHYSLPLIPNLMSWWLISSASKFIILNHLGVDANGIYAISSRFPSILVIINSVLVLPIQDAFLKEGSDFEYFKSVVKKFIKLELCLVLLLSVGAPIYTKLLVSDVFYSAWKFMPFLYLGVGFNTIAALISLVYQKEKKTIRITVTTFVGGIISILISFLVVDSMKLAGISIAFFVGYGLMFLLRYIDVTKNSIYKLSIDLNRIVLFIFVFFGIIKLIDYVDFAWQVIIFSVVLLIVLYLNKKLILQKLEYVTHKISK